jgi:hypothetical protein
MQSDQGAVKQLMFGVVESLRMPRLVNIEDREHKVLPSKTAAACVKSRWSKYLEEVIGSANQTRTAVARAIESEESRVGAWVTGRRGITAHKAFEVGERLRDLFEMPTSGVEALFACGAWSELFTLFNYLSGNYADDGNEIAVRLYCWLPAVMLAYERAWWDDQFEAAGQGDSGSLASDALRRYSDEWQGMEASIDLRRRTPRPIPEELTKLSRSIETRRIVAQAWGDSSRGQLRITLKHLTGVAKSGLSGTPIPYSQTRGQLFGVDGANELMAWIAELAERQRIMVPSLVAPRLWRQAAEWAYRRDRKGFEQYQDLLPLPYLTFEKQSITEEEAHYLDYLADERKERRTWLNGA